MTHDVTPIRPLTVATSGAPPVVRAGLASLLAPHHTRVRLTSSQPDSPAADVTLLDLDATTTTSAVALPTHGRLVGWTSRPGQAVIDQALARGVVGVLDKALSIEALLAGLDEIHRGRFVVRVTESAPDASVPWSELSHRELEVLRFVTRGLTNQEIADRCYLSINSVKTYIRSAYRKAGVTSRSAAVLWGVRHGLLVEETEGAAAPPRLASVTPLTG